MSIKIMSEVWASPEERHGHLLVLLAIADYASDEGVAYPSLTRIGEKARLSTRQVRRIIRELEETGILEISEDKSQWGTNIFKITPGHYDLRTNCPRTQLRPGGEDITMSAKPSVNHHKVIYKRKADSEQEVVDYCLSIGLTPLDGEFMWHHWEANGWKRGNSLIRNWKSAIKAWQKGGYLPSQKVVNKSCL